MRTSTSFRGRTMMCTLRISRKLKKTRKGTHMLWEWAITAHSKRVTVIRNTRNQAVWRSNPIARWAINNRTWVRPASSLPLSRWFLARTKSSYLRITANNSMPTIVTQTSPTSTEWKQGPRIRYSPHLFRTKSSRGIKIPTYKIPPSNQSALTITNSSNR